MVRLDSCFFAAFFSVTADVMNVVLLRAITQRSNFQDDFDQYKQLNPELIQEDWDLRNDIQPLATATSLLNAVAAIVFCIPVLQAAWKLSVNGTHLIGLHSGICILAIAAAVLEFLALVLMVGSATAMNWLSTDFNLSSWTASKSNAQDDIGWRTLEVVSISIQGMVLWVDAIDALFVAAILLCLFVSIRRQVLYSDSSNKRDVLSRGFGVYSFMLSIVYIVEFTAEVLRFKSWMTYTKMAFVITFFGRFILWPIWFLWLSAQLSRSMKMATTSLASPDASTEEK